MSKNNRMELTESFQKCFNAASTSQQNGMKLIVKNTNESTILDCILMHVSRIYQHKPMAFTTLISSITNALASEVLYNMFLKGTKDYDKKDFDTRLLKRNIYINSRIKNRSHDSRNNLIPIIMKMGVDEIPKSRSYRKLFTKKNKKFFLNKTKKSVSLNLLAGWLVPIIPAT